VSSELSLALVVLRGDHQIAQSPDQSKIHKPLDYLQVPREPVNEWDAQIEAGAVGQGKNRRKEVK
jgi:hypothetical protein